MTTFSTLTRTIAAAGLCAIATSTALAGQLYAAPRPPAPVFNGQDVAAVNATIQRFGFDFVTVGAPGNRSWLPHERQIPNGIFPNLIDDRGRVDYEYRIMRTEVVQTQYVDFVRAFRPYWLSIADIPGHIESGSPVDSRFTSRGISIFGGFDVNPLYDNSAVTISWRNAARYANWLHNGAPTDPNDLSWETFTTGAYTFTEGTFTGTSLEPITRNADARFWLPGLDELLKAAYYDPDRYDEGAPGGEEGYWPYPNSSEDAPWFGAPPPEGDGDWGGGDDDSVAEELTVGRYPHTVSPWGLLDVIGTAPEWTETPWGVQYNEDGEISYIAGRTVIGDTSDSAFIDNWMETPGTSGGHAFRLATIVPGPGVAGLFVLSGAFAARRRR